MDSAPVRSLSASGRAVAGLREFFLLEEAQKHALRLAGPRGDRARELHEAATSRRKCADELVGLPVLPASFVIYRDALRLFARARQLDRDAETPEDEALALDSLGEEIDLLDEARRVRFRATFDRLRDDDPLAFDRIVEGDVTRIREATDDFFRWLEGTVDPRTFGKLRAMRILRIAGAVVAILFLLRAGFRKIFAPADIAYGKTVTASSRYPGTPDPQGLTDGDTHALGVHTTVEGSPWITVDLGGSYKVRTIKVHNRTDCCLDEGLGLIVEVGDPGDPAPFTAQRAEHFDVWEIDAGGKQASTVHLRLPRNGYIALAELEVFADK